MKLSIELLYYCWINRQNRNITLEGKLSGEIVNNYTFSKAQEQVTPLFLLKREMGFTRQILSGTVKPLYSGHPWGTKCWPL